MIVGMRMTYVMLPPHVFLSNMKAIGFLASPRPLGILCFIDPSGTWAMKRRIAPVRLCLQNIRVKWPHVAGIHRKYSAWTGLDPVLGQRRILRASQDLPRSRWQH